MGNTSVLPPLAKQARISGDVVIDKTGSVVEMKGVPGPPPLIPAALAAVRTLRYEPTYLDDEPIDIQFILIVRFELQELVPLRSKAMIERSEIMTTATRFAKSQKRVMPEPVWINNILFLTDFSPTSNSALRHALSVARRFEAKVYVTHVVEPPLAAPLAAAFYDTKSARKDAEKKFNALLSAGKLNDVLHEIILAEGSLWPVVEKIIAEKKIDLILVGSHGRKGFRKMMLGSVAEAIYRKATCPVLTIGPENSANPESEMRSRRILLATDLRDEAHCASDYAIAMAERHAAELIVLHVIEDEVSDFGRAEQQRLASLARMEGLVPPETLLASKPTMVVARGCAADEIGEMARKYGADLIVIGVRGGKRMAGHLPSTVAYQVLCQALCPVLTVPAEFHG